MVLADELEADWTRIKIMQAQGDAKGGDVLETEDAPAKGFRTNRRSALEPHRRTPRTLPERGMPKLLPSRRI